MMCRSLPAVVTMLLVASAAPGQAQPADSDDRTLEAAAAPFEDRMLAARLARWGLAQEDPLALIMAARMRLSAPFSPVERGIAPETPVSDPATEWLEAAERLSGGDPRLVALISDLRATGTKGRLGGPKVSMARVGSGSVDRYREPFRPTAPAVVYVEGDGDTDLTLTVRAPGGAVVCREDDRGDLKMCVWTPTSAGPHMIEVSNAGAVVNAYSLATN